MAWRDAPFAMAPSPRSAHRTLFGLSSHQWGTVPHPYIGIHTTPAPQPSIPPRFVETILIAGNWRGQGLLEALSTKVRFVRKSFGQNEVLDFLALLFGYAISGERALQTVFDSLQVTIQDGLAEAGRLRA
jgi:hypothetical protein